MDDEQKNRFSELMKPAFEILIAETLRDSRRREAQMRLFYDRDAADTRTRQRKDVPIAK